MVATAKEVIQSGSIDAFKEYLEDEVNKVNHSILQAISLLENVEKVAEAMGVEVDLNTQSFELQALILTEIQFSVNRSLTKPTKAV